MCEFINGSREPISTYEQAVWRLAQMDATQTASVCSAVDIVADIFWIKKSRVEADITKALSLLGGVRVIPSRVRGLPPVEVEMVGDNFGYLRPQVRGRE